MYQGIPIGGYNKLIEALFEGADILTGVDFLAEKEKWLSMADKVIYTGAIDEYFAYCFGKLEYRTVRFETEVLDTDNYQGVAVVNYTDRETGICQFVCMIVVVGSGYTIATTENGMWRGIGHGTGILAIVCFCILLFSLYPKIPVHMGIKKVLTVSIRTLDSVSIILALGATAIMGISLQQLIH